MIKEQIKAIIKQYADKGERLYNESCETKEDSQTIGYWDGYRDCANLLLRELDDIQEEPTSVWHAASERAEKGRLYLYRTNQNVVDINRSEGKDFPDYCERWAYIDDLFKL